MVSVINGHREEACNGPTIRIVARGAAGGYDAMRRMQQQHGGFIAAEDPLSLGGDEWVWLARPHTPEEGVWDELLNTTLFGG